MYDVSWTTLHTTSPRITAPACWHTASRPCAAVFRTHTIPHTSSRTVTAIAAGVALSLLSILPAQALNGESATATAIILSPITAETTQDLQFGQILPSVTQASTVVVSHSSANSSICGALLTCMVPGQRAAVRLAGQPGQRFTVSTSSQAVLANGSAASMIMDNFTVGEDGSSAASTFHMRQDGTQDLYIGGRLHIGANQAPGAYVGSYTITADYQ